MARASTVANPLPADLRVLLPLLIASAFLTQIKLIPGLANNLGPFEILGGLVILGFFLRRRSADLRMDPAVRIVAAISLLALFSLTWIGAEQRFFGAVQAVIMVFLLLFLVAIHNLCLRYRFSPYYVLRWTVTSLLIVGPWIVIQGGATADIQAAGPFRNRAHMASYMLTAFWMALILALWPNLSKRLRYASYAAIAFSLYAVAISGRRSVYLSLFAGLVALALSFPGATRGRRLKVTAAAGVIVAFLGALYLFGGRISPRLEFFQKRVGTVGSRLQAAVGAEDARTEATFFALQRQGIRQAVLDQPLLGIGWGGFAKSVYSPTGHEVHSTPLRFLAELGLVGLALYLALIVTLVSRTVWLYRWMRSSPHGPAYLALLIGFGSMCVSYLYNRHVTERTFWLFLALILTMDSFTRFQVARRAVSAAPKPDSMQEAGRAPLGPPELALAQRGSAGGRQRPREAP